MPITVGAVATTPTAKTPGFYDPSQDPTNSSLKELGRVNAIVEWNGVVYCAGNFDHVIDNSGTSAVDHSGTGYSYLSAHRADTGAVITTWTPTIGGRLYALGVSPDGTTLVAGGDDGLHAWTPLTGPTDTSAPASITMPAVTKVRGLYITNTTLFIAGNFTTVGGHATSGSAKITKSGTWSVAAGYTCAGPAGTVKCMTAKSDGSKVVIGGDFNGAVLAYNGADGTAATWNFNFSTGEGEGVNQSCISMTSDDNMVAMGGDFGPDIMIVTDWTGSGPNAFSNITGGWNGYWYHTCDGNVQVMAIGQMNGAPVLYNGHHGNFASAAKNTDTSSSDPRSTGVFVVPWTTTGGDRVAWGDPPAFGNPSSTSTPLKVWSIYQSSVSGTLHIGGDFTSAVTPQSLNSQRRYAMFTASVTGGGGGGGGGGPVPTYGWRKSAEWGGGYAMVCAADPNTVGRYGVGGDLWGVFQSTDGGNSLNPGSLGKNISIDGGTNGLYCRAVAYSKKIPGRMFLGWGGLGGSNLGVGGLARIDGVFFYTASGDTVNGFGTNNQNGNLRPRAGGRLIAVDYDAVANVEYVYALETAPSAATIVRTNESVASGTTIYSTTIGPTWPSVLNGAWKALCLMDTDADGAMDAMLVASYRDPTLDGTTPGGSKIWKITAGGQSIRTASTTGQLTVNQVTSGVPSVVNDMVAGSDGNIYAACGPFGVYKVTGNGATWTAVAGNSTFTGLPYAVSCIDVMGTGASAKLVVGTTRTSDGNRVAVSTDAGATWTWVTSATVSHNNTGQTCSVPWGTTEEWWLMATGAPSFTNYLGGATLDVQQICFDPHDATGHTFFCVGSAGAWLTKSNGTNWRPMNVGLNGGEISHVHAGAAGAVYCDNTDFTQATSGDYFRSATRSLTTPTGFTNSGLADKTDAAGNTYRINTSSLTAPDILYKPAGGTNFTSIANTFAQASMFALSDFQVSPDGTVYIANFGGGVLVGDPGGSGGGGGGGGTWTVPIDGSDDGKFLRILETATDAVGNVTTQPSAVVGPIGSTTTVPVNTTPPSVDQILVQPGDTITWTPGVWANSPTGHIYFYQRRQTGSSTIVATTSLGSPSYLVVPSDIGYDVRFEEIDSNAAGSSQPAFSPWTTIKAPPITNPTVPTITLITPSSNITIIGDPGTAYRVTGSVVSDTAIAVCFVNAQVVSVDPTDGSFAVTVALSQGVNPITVIATDADGDTSTITNTITLATTSGGGGGDGGGEVAEGVDLVRLEHELNQRGLE